MEELITEKDIIMRGGAGAPGAAAAARVRPGLPQDYSYAFAVPAVLGADGLPEDALKGELLQIVNDGMNNIVKQIKLKLGANNIETNTNARDILQLLDNITATIDGNIRNIGVHGNNTHINIDRNAAGIYSVNAIDNQYYSSDIIDAADLKAKVNRKEFTSTGILGGKKIDMETLDSNYNNYLDNDQFHIDINPDVIHKENVNVVEDDHKYTVENRLANCQLLEMLYMIKHEELMKTFAFTLNLFDKYKYAIKIMLFLLKHLVNKPNPPAVPIAAVPDPAAPAPPAPVNIRLPKALIPNIKKLLQDQEKVQEIITSMQDAMATDKDTILDPATGAQVNKVNFVADGRLDDLSSSRVVPVEPTNAGIEGPVRSGAAPP